MKLSGGVDIQHKKITIRWTCSDYCKHSHRWKWSAWLCGRVQKAIYDFKVGYAEAKALADKWERLMK